MLFPALLLLLGTSCVAWTPRSVRTSPSATVLPDIPMQKWGIESCGAGSLSTVLQHYGDKTSMNEWDATLPKVRGGVITIDLILAARKRGFDAELVTGTPDLVTEEVAKGHPVILMLQVVEAPGTGYDFFHYIVVDGLDRDRKLIRSQFGDGKARWISFARLEKPWAGGGHAALLIRPRDGITDSLRAAVALEDAGNYADAAASYRTILTAHPDSTLVWTNLGNAEMQLGKRAEAEEAFRKALAIDQKSRDALNNLAWLLYQQNRLPEAENFARQAVAQPGPDPYLVLDTLARILAAKGACDEAVTTFDKALQSVPASRASARDDLEKGLADTRRSCHS
ncbi:MAG: hypothetical protein QOI24_1591 [Acidobacteriota bacterium]|jgi:predicted negative regulator of RcsB-dependent stress response|nr:hypothetical protein [Acidobacteriota bacterium]